MLGTLAHIRARYGSVEQVSSKLLASISSLSSKLERASGMSREHVSGALDRLT